MIRETERAAIIGQLVALDNVLHGILESLQAGEETDRAPDCPHPIEQRQYHGGTMGSGAMFTCGQCNTVVAPAGDGSLNKE